MITKEEIDGLAARFEVEDFIKDDPIQFPHRFSDKKDVEIAGFVASILAWGKRKVFIRKLDELFGIMEHQPYDFVLNFEPGVFGDFNYRFYKPEDFVNIFSVIRDLYKNDGGLEGLFRSGYEQGNLFPVVVDYFYSRAGNNIGHGAEPGFYHMIPNPGNNGAMKRMNMFMRWMVRKGPVDLGVWDFMPAADLLIPLDVHVARVSREMGLLAGKSNNFKAVLELTEKLKLFDPLDPVKYDFAMFGYGINS